MTDEAWAQGMADLVSSFPERDLPASMLERRGEVYRRELGHLTDGQWYHAVSEALRSERWFPPVSMLLEAASRAPQETPRGALVASTLTHDERRELMREGMARIRAEMARRAMPLDALPDMPAAKVTRGKPRDAIEATPERLALLQTQAAQIGGTEA